MRILFDQGVPAPLRQLLSEHEVVTAHERGWSTLKNGDLLAAARHDGFEVFVTTDKHLKHQQNLSDSPLTILVLGTTSWPRIRQSAGAIIAAIAAVAPGDYVDIEIA